MACRTTIFLFSFRRWYLRGIVTNFLTFAVAPHEHSLCPFRDAFYIGSCVLWVGLAFCFSLTHQLRVRFFVGPLFRSCVVCFCSIHAALSVLSWLCFALVCGLDPVDIGEYLRIFPEPRRYPASVGVDWESKVCHVRCDVMRCIVM